MAVGYFSADSRYYIDVDAALTGQSGNTSFYYWRVMLVKTAGSGFWAAHSGSNNFTSSWAASGAFAYDFRGSTPKTIMLAEGNSSHNHDGNGYGSINFSASANLVSLGYAAASGSLGFPRIPKAPGGAPHSLTLDQKTPTSMRLQFSGSGVDNGGSGITGWQAQLATNAAFTTGVQLVNSSGTTNWTGLSQHTQYWTRARAVNAVGAGPWSGAISGSTVGHPTAPLSVTATPSSTSTGLITINWAAPTTTGAGGIVGYNVYRDGALIATTTGATITPITDVGRTPYTSYTYTVSARNAYSTSVSGTGPQSAGVSAVAPGPPSAPSSLAGASSTTTPGEVTLTWGVPANTGAGGITGYTVRLADGTFLKNSPGTALSTVVSGLTPGLAYTFVVTARNALADAEGSESAYSPQVIVTPIGEPNAPTGFTVTPSVTTSNRLVLSWTAPSGALSGYSIFREIGGTYVLIAMINQTHTSFAVDGLTSGQSYSFHVRARTVYTDTLTAGYPGNWGGPATPNVSGTATSNSTQSTPLLSAVTSATNAIFNGTYTINQITATTIRYARTAANIASAASGGTIANNTNAVFNGTFTIATPTPTTMTYSKTNANIAALDTTGGLVTDNTNVGFNGTFVVTAVNVGANLISYTSLGSDLAARAVPLNVAPGQFGTVKNLSNAIFNGAGRILTSVTEYTMTYAQTNANVAESNAAGVVINATNRDVFNGDYIVASIPAYNIVRYAKTAANIATRTWTTPNGVAYRTVSPSTLDVRFRSGWSG